MRIVFDCGYPSGHAGDGRERAGRVFRADEGESGPRAQSPWPPGFPTVAALSALNKRIHQDALTPERYALDEPGALHDRLATAAEAWRVDGGPHNTIRVAALLAYGIAQAQAFRDGNRRTAYFAVRHFLEVNDLAWLSDPEASDDMLARRLNQIVNRQSATGYIGSPDPIEALLARRFERRSRMREHMAD